MGEKPYNNLSKAERGRLVGTWIQVVSSGTQVSKMRDSWVSAQERQEGDKWLDLGF